MGQVYVYRPGHPKADEHGFVEKEIAGPLLRHDRRDAFTYMPDKAGYVSPVDDRYYEGRVAHKKHMREHGLEEVGNEKPKPRKFVDMPPAAPDIAIELKKAGVIG